MYRRLRSKGTLFAAVPLSLALAVGVSGATADHTKRAEQHRAKLDAVPRQGTKEGNSNASGTAKLVRKGNRVSVPVKAMGLSPGLPHAMHIHGRERPVRSPGVPGPSAATTSSTTA